MAAAHIKLTGPFEGKTIVLNGRQFVDGILKLEGKLSDSEGLITYFERAYQAELVMATGGDKDDQMRNEGKNGVSQTEGEVNEKLLAAVMKLDPANDEHWTQGGDPAISAIEVLYGSAGVKRADIKAVAPGFTREVAKAQAEGQ